MSHSHGLVFSKSAPLIIIAHYEYDGTSDITLSHLYKSYKEVSDNWRKGDWLKCTCKNEPILCFLYSDYGSGFYWEGKVCIKCRAIVEGFEPEETFEGRPDGKPTNYQIIVNNLKEEEAIHDEEAIHKDW